MADGDGGADAAAQRGGSSDARRTHAGVRSAGEAGVHLCVGQARQRGAGREPVPRKHRHRTAGGVRWQDADDVYAGAVRHRRRARWAYGRMEQLVRSVCGVSCWANRRRRKPEAEDAQTKLHERRWLAAARQSVFDAWTKAELLAQWWGAGGLSQQGLRAGCAGRRQPSGGDAWPGRERAPDEREVSGGICAAPMSLYLLAA